MVMNSIILFKIFQNLQKNATMFPKEANKIEKKTQNIKMQKKKPTFRQQHGGTA